MKINDEEMYSLAWWIDWTSDYMQENVRRWEYQAQLNEIDPKTVEWKKYALNNIQRLNTRIINKIKKT